MATLMALLAGAPLDEVRRGVQHGHPQLTLADLLGGPLPGCLVRAEEAGTSGSCGGAGSPRQSDYRRVQPHPDQDQSALLSLMAEGYAECTSRSSTAAAPPGT